LSAAGISGVKITGEVADTQGMAGLGQARKRPGPVSAPPTRATRPLTRSSATPRACRKPRTRTSSLLGC